MKKIPTIGQQVKDLSNRMNKLEDSINKFTILNLPSVYTNDYEDNLYDEAVKVAKEYEEISASLLQRRLSIGYARSARLIDMLEEKKIIGTAKFGKPRKVLASK